MKEKIQHFINVQRKHALNSHGTLFFLSFFFFFFFLLSTHKLSSTELINKARMRNLVCAFVVPVQQNQAFSRRGDRLRNMQVEAPRMLLLTLISSISSDRKMPSAVYVCCTYSSTLQTRFYHGSKHYEPRSDCSREP